MATFQMKHDLDCTPERFWELFFDKEFNEKLFKALEFPEWVLLEQKDEGSEIVRRVKATPKMEAPGAVAKVLGSSFGYTEESRFDKATKTHRFVIKPTTMADKMKNEGTVRCDAVGEGKSRRVVDVIAEAKIFGVGGMIESSLEKSFRTGWGKSAEFINQWVKDHP